MSLKNRLKRLEWLKTIAMAAGMLSVLVPTSIGLVLLAKGALIGIVAIVAGAPGAIIGHIMLHRTESRE